jgi:hypothetical protein
MFLVYCILIIVTVCVTIVATYFLLNAEDWRWHWTAFASGGISITLFLSSMHAITDTVVYLTCNDAVRYGHRCKCSVFIYVCLLLFLYKDAYEWFLTNSVLFRLHGRILCRLVHTLWYSSPCLPTISYALIE